MSQWLEGRVIEKQYWSDRLYSLRIDAPIADFRAGQFTRGTRRVRSWDAAGQVL
jgi:ferredoxin--NADP+ reductase